MKYPLRWIAGLAGLVVATLAVILALNVGTDPRVDLNRSRLLGKPAPAFILTRFDGTKLRSADLAGKTVILNFWNSWCLPCREELPTLQRWYAGHAEDEATVLVGIPRDDSSSAIRQSARDDGMAWAVANDRGAQAATLAYGTRGQPETFVISPGGQIVGSIIGPVTNADLDRMARVGRGL